MFKPRRALTINTISASHTLDIDQTRRSYRRLFNFSDRRQDMRQKMRRLLWADSTPSLLHSAPFSLATSLYAFEWLLPFARFRHLALHLRLASSPCIFTLHHHLALHLPNCLNLPPSLSAFAGLAPFLAPPFLSFSSSPRLLDSSTLHSRIPPLPHSLHYAPYRSLPALMHNSTLEAHLVICSFCTPSSFAHVLNAAYIH
ncbi:hypothetical protein AOQ84DRAFT_156645 [Glonium stellatum]|uniref:Uncharacterized protein n=1 Tax=Glonium stellatum TaxID=574774 RepID=A0A8E2ER78_9PEZI|nr:hypothetical protein AOQ84DRAFT_156645 [Glonium stellatum]